MKLINYLVALSILFGFSACEKDDDDSEVIGKTIEIKANEYATWTYFSFKDGKIVKTDAVTNDASYKSSTNWDIAFHRMDVKTNGGKSGNGKSEAVLIKSDATLTDFNEIKVAPATGYIKDVSTMLMVGLGDMMQGGKPDMAPSTKSEELGKWISMGYMPSSAKAGPKCDVKNNIYAVKTADGKYVKLWIKGYKNNAGDGGYITIQYVYQPDGSKNF